MVKVYIRGQKVWLYSSVNGIGYRYSSGYTKDKIKYVEKQKDILFNEIHNKKINNIKLSFKDYGRYVLEITSSNRSEFSQKEYLQKFNKLCTYFNCDIIDIKTSTLMSWQNSLNLAPKTIIGYRSIINIILETALADDIIYKNPLKYVSAPKIKRVLPDVYRLDEVNILLSNTKGQFKLLLEFAFFSGMRPSEIIALKWEYIDFENNSIKVFERIRDGNIGLPKGDKVRIIDLLPRAKKALENQLNLTSINEYVFITQYNEPYKNSHVLDTLFKNLCNKSNLRIGRFYDTKKFFCTFCEENINNETWLTQQVGHEDIQVTRNHYIGKVKIDFSNIKNIS
ncbi:MAG: site-specific integrase [Campylobacterota bacterium]|nr:site-specific integrase [Campylobacterota bacterium]